MTSETPTSLLIVLDGWGYSENPDHNAIHHADTPNWDRLWADCPHTLISGSGLDVGLPSGQMGNSEVGHMNIGAGRVVYQDLTRIDKAIADGSFTSNATIDHTIDRARGKRLHVMGLLSPGGVHSHDSHFAALIDHAAGKGAEIIVHAFLDGRDTPPRSASQSLENITGQLQRLGAGRIGSICGRYYAMDRDARWDRVEAAYRMLVDSAASYDAPDAVAGLQAAYARDEGDEFVSPTIIGEPAPVRDDDSIMFMNFRADRARELSHAFVDAEFNAFDRPNPPRLDVFATMTQYAADLGCSPNDTPTRVAFPPETVGNSLGEHLAKLGKTQLRLAETEKYAHVTFFFSGGREDPFAGEQRILVPSPKVRTYDLQPQMSAFEVTTELTAAVAAGDLRLHRVQLRKRRHGGPHRRLQRGSAGRGNTG